MKPLFLYSEFFVFCYHLFVYYSLMFLSPLSLYRSSLLIFSRERIGFIHLLSLGDRLLRPCPTASSNSSPPVLCLRPAIGRPHPLASALIFPLSLPSACLGPRQEAQRSRDSLESRLPHEPRRNETSQLKLATMPLENDKGTT